MNKQLAAIVLGIPLFSCSNHAPMKTVDYVDIDRFMGDWYVVASIPTFLEIDAHNAVETYTRNADGTIATTFKFLDGSFDGELKEYHPTGFIQDTNTNAIWGMQFIWPIKADYRIVYLDDNYSKTIIARKARDYVWLMSRKPTLSSNEYDELVNVVHKTGYDTSKLITVPHRWPVNQGKNTEMRGSE